MLKAIVFAISFVWGWKYIYREGITIAIDGNRTARAWMADGVLFIDLYTISGEYSRLLEWGEDGDLRITRN